MAKFQAPTGEDTAINRREVRNHAHARNLDRRAVEPVNEFQNHLLDRRAVGDI
ncbi:MAG: hypothetical protein LC808_37605 [Actinobacteria bacterium]|nr:hypothetical protein [Actinomycetota bacterium]